MRRIDAGKDRPQRLPEIAHAPGEICLTLHPAAEPAATCAATGAVTFEEGVETIPK